MYFKKRRNSKGFYYAPSFFQDGGPQEPSDYEAEHNELVVMELIS